MPAVGVKAHEHIPEPGLAEGLVGPLHALAVVAHRILVAGHEVHRGVLVHGVDVLLVSDEFDAAHHVPVQAGLGHKAAERVVDVFSHHLVVLAEPVEVGHGEADLLVVRAEGQVV